MNCQGHQAHMVVGRNAITIVVTGPDGFFQTYTVTVTRKGEEAISQNVPVLPEEALSAAVAIEKAEWTANEDHCKEINREESSYRT